MQEFIPLILPPNFNFKAENYALLAEAASRLGELKGFAKIIPNQDILINSLVLQEAKDSNAIENIITTHDELFLAQIDASKATKNVKEVQNYETALKLGEKLGILQSIKIGRKKYFINSKLFKILSQELIG